MSKFVSIFTLVAVTSTLLVIAVAMIYPSFRTEPEETTKTLNQRVFGVEDVETADKLHAIVRKFDRREAYTEEEIDLVIDLARNNETTHAFAMLGWFRDYDYRRQERTEILLEAAQRRPRHYGSTSAMLSLVRTRHPQARSIVVEALRDRAFRNKWDQDFLKRMLDEYDHGHPSQRNVQPTTGDQ